MSRAFLLFLILSSTAYSAVCDQAQNCLRKFQINKSFLRYYQSHKDFNNDITKVIIVVHGALRNGDEYFEHMVEAADKNQVLHHTAILAPHFRKVTDERMPGELYWGRRWYTKWKYGYVSEDEDRISSFEVMDRLVEDLYRKFPKLKKVIITGHSAGGQFTQRYAVGTKIHKRFDIVFAPSNPSSFMYLHKNRYDFELGNFIEVNEENCPEYDHYIYGLKDRARYLQKMSSGQLRENYAEKKVIYLMSEQDTENGSLDRSCEANLQGNNRINRAINYFHYVKKHFKEHQHRFVGIPDIGHDHEKVFGSFEAGQVLFETQQFIDNSLFSYRKFGNTQDVQTWNQFYFLMLGGGKNEIGGMHQFLKDINGGNLLVLSGKEKLHNRYTFDFWRMANEVGIKLQSVEVISLHHRKAAQEKFVLEAIERADGIFFTGGNQAKYIHYLKGTKALKEIIDRSVPIGGTSAGLAIMGEYIFAARNGGVSSRYALKYPEDKVIDIEKGFFEKEETLNLVTDTHFSERNREGRLLSFMARAQSDFYTRSLYGLGIDEQTSVQLTHDQMIVQGKGNAILYFSEAMPSSTRNGLSYGPIRKAILKKNQVLPHFEKFVFPNSGQLEVVEGSIRESR